MRTLVGVFAIVAILCATPLSLRWSRDNDLSLLAVFASASAAELNLPVRHHGSAIRHGRYAAYYSRLYDPYCNGPYTGGGWNGGTYYGGPWIDLRCYGAEY